MGSKGQLNLNYSEEFRVACTINNLKYEDVLQNFINYVSFYVFSGGEIDQVYKWATKVIVDCRTNINIQPEIIVDQHIKKIYLKYIPLLTELSVSSLPARNKIQKSFSIMQDWSEAMIGLIDYPDAVELNDKHILTLTFDFNLLCKINGVDAEQVLQYFINGISLAEDRALNLYENIEVKPCTAVIRLQLVRDNMAEMQKLSQERIHVNYGLRLLDLDEKLENEGNLKYKIHVYKAFYLDWYNALRVRIN